MNRSLHLLLVLAATHGCGKDAAPDQPVAPTSQPEATSRQPEAKGGGLLAAPIDRALAERLSALEVDGLEGGPGAVRDVRGLAAERLYNIPSKQEGRHLAVSFRVQPCSARPELCPARMDAAWAGREIDEVRIPVSLGFSLPSGATRTFEGMELLVLRAKEDRGDGASVNQLVWLSHNGKNLILVSAAGQMYPASAPPTDAELEDAVGRVLRALMAAR